MRVLWRGIGLKPSLDIRGPANDAKRWCLRTKCVHGRVFARQLVGPGQLKGIWRIRSHLRPTGAGAVAWNNSQVILRIKATVQEGVKGESPKWPHS